MKTETKNNQAMEKAMNNQNNNADFGTSANHNETLVREAYDGIARHYIAAVVGGLLLFSGAAFAQTPAFDAFVHIAGIPGDATDVRFKEWTQVYSFSHDESMGDTVVGSTMTKVEFADVLIVKALDKGSPKLNLACAKGSRIPSVVIAFVRTTGDKAIFYRIIMTDVLVTGVRPSGTTLLGSMNLPSPKASTVPTEDVTLRATSIQWEYIPVDAQGQPVGSVKANWDVSANKGS